MWPLSAIRRKKNAPSEPPSKGVVEALTFTTAGAVLPLLFQLPWTVTLYFTALLGLRLASLRLKRLQPGRLALLPFTFGGIALVAVNFHTLIGHEAGITLLGLMLALKLLELRTPRDLYLAVFLLQFLIVSQFLVDQSILLSMWLLLVVIALLAVLAAYHRQGRGGALPQLKYAAGLALQALPVAAVLFLLFPRLSAPLWKLDLGHRRGLTGLGDSMSPGAISELVQSDDPAFRARFEGKPPAPELRYWRGPVFWHTDGRRWTKGIHRKKSDSRSAQVEPILSSNPYVVIQEPSNKRWLFALDIPSQAPPRARMTADFQLLALRPVTKRRQYRMTSFLRYRGGALTVLEKSSGLQLPSNVTGRMRRLVEGWKKESGNDHTLVRHALRYFREQPFVYTLTPPLLGNNPTDEFLFESRAGFCEHYAGSFTLLMRIGGIPSRVVTGYLGGELNPVGEYFIVRQSDAHAWSEVWLAGRGWTRVDPTAAIAPERIEHAISPNAGNLGEPVIFDLRDAKTLLDIAHRIGLLYDALNTGWHRWVLGYDTERQKNLLRWLGLGGLDRFGMVVLMITVSFAVVALIAGWFQTRGRRQERDPVKEQYLIFRKRLAAAGIEQHPDEGPTDLARRASGLRPDLKGSIGRITGIYIRLRYSGRGTSRDRKLLASLVRAFRPSR